MTWMSRARRAWLALALALLVVGAGCHPEPKYPTLAVVGATF